MPVIVLLEITRNVGVTALTSVPIRDRVVVPGLAAEMLATLRHFGVNAREDVRLVGSATHATDSQVDPGNRGEQPRRANTRYRNDLRLGPRALTWPPIGLNWRGLVAAW